MVHTWVFEEYIYISLMHRTDHIFPVLLIKQLVNTDGEATAPQKLVADTKPSVSNLHVLLCPCVLQKVSAHVDTKALNMCR